VGTTEMIAGVLLPRRFSGQRTIDYDRQHPCGLARLQRCGPAWLLGSVPGRLGQEWATTSVDAGSLPDCSRLELLADELEEGSHPNRHVMDSTAPLFKDRVVLSGGRSASASVGRLRTG
jgi:hypothetical protein